MASLNSNTRVTASEVKEIFDTDIEDSALHNFINMAAERVDDISDADSSVSSTRLELIEMNLAAHYASTLDPRVSQEQIADARFKYKGVDETTDYWMTAVDLDPTNTLTLESKPEANIHVLDGRDL